MFNIKKIRSYLNYKQLLLGTAVSLVIPAITAAQNTLTIDDFKSGISSRWQEKKFKGSTQYTAAIKDNQTGILAESNGTASGLFYEIEFDPSQFPILEWSWQIDHVVPSGDARQKKGDDYAARIYVVFPSVFFWRTKALNYIWANKLPKEEFCANAYTANNVMIAVQSGNQLAGITQMEQRNIIEDYQKAFGEPPPKVGAIAIMTDTDDTKEQARSWYGPITVKSLLSHNAPDSLVGNRGF